MVTCSGVLVSFFSLKCSSFVWVHLLNEAWCLALDVHWVILKPKQTEKSGTPKQPLFNRNSCFQSCLLGNSENSLPLFFWAPSPETSFYWETVGQKVEKEEAWFWAHSWQMWVIRNFACNQPQQLSAANLWKSSCILFFCFPIFKWEMSQR